MLLVVLMSMAALAQNSGEVAVPLSDPAKKAKLKAHLNYGSITIKGTARKDVLVKYAAATDKDDDDDDHDDDNDHNGNSNYLRSSHCCLLMF